MSAAALRLAGLLVALVAAAAPLVARADGEAGIVVQVGDDVRTYCVAFEGESITGEQALERAGLAIEKFGNNTGRVVCAIDDVGCFDPDSFDGCFCECTGAECTYWAFYIKPAGQQNWVRSPVGFNAATLRDGDMHGWRWGTGTTSSAPVPVDLAFADVCPRVEPTATPTAPPPTATPTFTPASAGGVETPSPAVASPTEAPATAVTASPTAIQTLTPNPFTPRATPPPAQETWTGEELSPTAVAPADGNGSGGDGGLPGSVIAFAAVSVALLAAIGGALAWRRRRGI